MPNDRKKAVAYITRWGLTEGIIKVGGELVDGGKYFSSDRKGMFHVWVGRSDYALTIEEAEAQVLDKAKRKLKALDKQRAKLDRIVAAKGQVPLETK